MAYTVQIGSREFCGLRTNVHMHTTLSDGTRSREEIGRIAAQAGLDAIIITDHNVYKPGGDGFVGNTLVLVGEEIHDPDREQQSSHLLCFNIHEDMAGHAANPQMVVDAAARGGGFSFLAHPFERDAPEFLPEPNISWRDWHIDGYEGIELWNFMSEFKSVLKNKPQAVIYAFLPALAICGPHPETLRKWDQVLASRPLAAFGGSDAHGTIYHMGPISRAVQPYDHLFRSINTHLLSEEPLSGSVERDRNLVYKALRAGHSFLGYEQPGGIAGFAFWACSRNAEASMGETIRVDGRIKFHVATPAPAQLRLLRDGRVVARMQGKRLTMIAHEPGVYRVEAYRRYAGRERGWIFSNPIYVS